MNARTDIIRRLARAIVIGVVAPAAMPAQEPAVTASEARDALTRATRFMQSIATEGGYLWRYSTDLAERAGENTATATQIWVQTPGTPAMGMAFLRAYEVTRDASYLAAARAAALALVRGQLESGGWDYLIEFDPAERPKWRYRVDGTGSKAKNISTYDDDNTQGALRFLLAFGDAAKTGPAPDDGTIAEATAYGLRKFIEAQYPAGGWPQRWDGQPHDAAAFPVKQAGIPAEYPREQPSGSYYGHYTFNDGTHRDAIMTLIDAHRRTGRQEYLDAAKRGADFILLAQLPEPQPVWAQQYNATLEPAWARAFEPPSVTASESAGIVRLLVDLYVEWGDEKYLRPLPAALAWFERSALAPNQWARLYELQTNRPIYGDRDRRIHYTLEEISEERRRGYAWRGGFGVASARRYYEDVTAAGRETWLARRDRDALTPERRARRVAELAPRVREVIDALDDDGRWLTAARGTTAERVETRRFITNGGLLCDYLALLER